ncbi:Uncharacterized protein FWK35_00022372 [Aphis craccivora]|uniref:Uncharacterized protein n=1 Tax=Aphis craccivora TaxID=307492 RepID=A0A6G0XQX6_APHCR|nr:Uncharacterized protein FWK35_00022372 [Aphis craccivora]
MKNRRLFRHYLHVVVGRNHHVLSDRDYIFVSLERGILFVIYYLFVRCYQDLTFLVCLKTDQQLRYGKVCTSQLQWIYFYLSTKLHYALVSYIPNTRQR